MCLDRDVKKYVKSKDFIEGYKVLKRDEKGWKSFHALQHWEFGELIKAKLPRNVGFTGEKGSDYRRGIHAYKKFERAYQEFGDVLHRPTILVVKVLLFGVTHYDWKCCRADAAIIIETLNGETGERIPWPGEW